jgi:hypothetical protein
MFGDPCIAVGVAGGRQVICIDDHTFDCDVETRLALWAFFSGGAGGTGRAIGTAQADKTARPLCPRSTGGAYGTTRTGRTLRPDWTGYRDAAGLKSSSA